MQIRKLGLGLLAAAVLAGGLGIWWRHQAIYPTTEDAYVQAHIVTISPEVAGRVAHVDVVENQKVARGDVLLTLDTRALQATLDAAQAHLDQAKQAARTRQSNADAAAAALVAAQARLQDASEAFDRSAALLANKTISKRVFDDAQAARDQAKAGVDQARAGLAAAQAVLAPEGSVPADVRAAQAELRQAQLNLEHATLRAPSDGWVANLDLEKGAYVTPGAPLFSLVDAKGWYVEANFKETDLERIRPGQPATLSLSMYPQRKLTGHVESLGIGSGSTFALLPPQNASGNWVRVTQRFPVRIALDASEQEAGTPLRAGASATVQIDTHAQQGASQ